MLPTLFRPDLEGLSRRDFLKLSGLGLAALFNFPKFNAAPQALLAPDIELSCQGRVLEDQVNWLEKPSLSAKVLKTLRRDQVTSIRSATLGGENPPDNRVWYEIEGGGYIHSSGLQPMAVRQNPVETSIPSRGLPAEVTVPFTDATWSARPPGPIAYRLYYGAVFWIKAVVQDDKGQSWYRIVDEGEPPI